MQQLLPNSLLKGGAYKIEKVLGQGSFGITYLAMHTALAKRVAIKEFFMKEINGRGEDGSITGMSDGSLSMNYARKFQKEALNLSRLEHPNIVRVTDSFEDNGTFYYVMDYIEGENLNDYIKHNQVSQQEAVDIIRDVANALMYMHEEKHMLHLDLKPGNIMRRSSDGHIFLIDFGLSKHYSNDGQPETSTTIGLGTAGYAPIEQANQAKNGEFRPTIDVYALGATFYKLLTRETPPAASELVSDDELLAKSLKLHNINDHLAKVVINAMLPSVRERTPSVTEFLSSLNRDATNDNGTCIRRSNEEETTINRQSVEDETIIENSSNGSVRQSDCKDENEGISNNSFFAGTIAKILTAAFILLVVIVCLRNCGGQSPSANVNNANTVYDSDTLVADSADILPNTNGYQEMTYSDGSTYKGYMVNGQYEGQGTYCEPSTGYTYEGNWHNNIPSGYGIQVWKNETRKSYMCRYEGYFKNGERSGSGTAYYVNKTYYTGTWKKGELVQITEEGTWK